MTNDTNTLNGALQELGETMADNLTTMGVPSTYDEGLTTLAQKILSIGPTPPTPTPASVDLTGTKSILSYADSEQSVLTATVLDSNDNPVEGVDVNLYNGSTLWDTLTTDSSGECSKTYSSAGSGDITFTAEVDGTLLTKTYDIEDCSYYNTSEVSRTTTQGSTIYDGNLSQSLPSKCEISLDVWSNNTSTGEHRFFIMPKTQYSSGTTQPQYAIYFDLLRNNQLGLGKRENNSSQSTGIDTQTGVTLQTYHTIKFVKDGTSISAYIDGSLKGTFTLSWIGNYSDYTVSMMRWSASGTSKIKNVKFKPL